MKLYFLLLWISVSDPQELTFPTMRACVEYRATVLRGALVSRCLMRETA